MNQILNTDFNDNTDLDKSKNELFSPYDKRLFDNKLHKRKAFNIQFVLSIISIFVFSSFYIYYRYSLSKKENLSNNIISNYNLSKLYSNYTSDNQTGTNYSSPILGIIEIPKINIYYPIFSNHDENLLKFSPCRFSGDMPTSSSSSGNLCIAGHNYDNNDFFSNISLLSSNDEIYIYNNDGNKFCYYVFKNYEVKSDDLSPLELSNNGFLELTLITCNNINNNRIIIKAKTEST